MTYGGGGKTQAKVNQKKTTTRKLGLGILK